MKFKELLGMQKQLDETVEKPRKSGYIPRKRTLLDIKLALDDEFQEWLRELPDEYNFKTWKEKIYDREKELIELTDILFFFLAYINLKKGIEKNNCCRVWDNFKPRFSVYNDEKDFLVEIQEFKQHLWFREYLSYALMKYINIVLLRGFTKEDIVNQYCKKWKENISSRVDGDWSL